MGRKRGGLAGLWDRSKKVITPIATGIAGLIGTPALAAALGAAMKGLDREGKSGIGFDAKQGVIGGMQGYGMGKLGQGLGNLAGKAGLIGAPAPTPTLAPTMAPTPAISTGGMVPPSSLSASSSAPRLSAALSASARPPVDLMAGGMNVPAVPLSLGSLGAKATSGLGSFGKTLRGYAAQAETFAKDHPLLTKGATGLAKGLAPPPTSELDQERIRASEQQRGLVDVETQRQRENDERRKRLDEMIRSIMANRAQVPAAAGG